MVSLCEKCQNYNWRKMQDIIDTFRDAGLDRPNHIWCQAANQPEDIQWTDCTSFKPYATGNTIESKQRYCNYPKNLSGHRKIKPRKAS